MTGWALILPVKPWRLAKSRLELCADDRIRLARAISLDVLAATLRAKGVERLVVVTAEGELGAIARSAGALVVQDRPMLATGMLNSAIDAGRRSVQFRLGGMPVAVIPGDLAALTADALDNALDQMACEERSFVPDSSGTGTTLLSAARPELLVPYYGVHSALRHAMAGYTSLSVVDESCRRDVDTVADLASARHLGVGQHTTAVLDDMAAAANGRREHLRVSLR